MTKEISTGAVLSLLTGVMLCNFAEMQEAADFLTGESTYTHQFAHKPFCEEMTRGILAQHPELADVDASHVDRDNWAMFVLEQIGRFGPTLTIEPMAKVQTFGAAFVEPLKLIGSGAK